MSRYWAALVGVAFSVSGCAVIDLGNNDVRPATIDGHVRGPAAPGNESILFSVTGASLGKYFSARAAKMLDRRDDQSVAIAADRSFRSGDPIKWKNTETGNRGRIDPGPTYQLATGRVCRDFTHVFWRDRGKRQANGTACRLEDGSWEISG